MATITERVTALIATQLSIKPETIHPGSSLIDDLGADSLDVVELTMGLEESFDLTIQDDQAEQLLTVADVVRFVESTQAVPS